jgi:hypothetical protein
MDKREEIKQLRIGLRILEIDIRKNKLQKDKTLILIKNLDEILKDIQEEIEKEKYLSFKVIK